MKRPAMRGNPVAHPNRAIFNAYTLVGIVYCISFTLVYYTVAQNTFLSLVHFLALTIIAANYFVLTRTGNFRRATTIFLATGLAVVVSLFATGGWENTGYLWPPVYLIFVFFISAKTPWYWVFYTFAACLIVVVLSFLRIIHQAYSYIVLLNYFAALGIITIFIYYFKKASIDYELRLQGLAEDLEKQVKVKTAELAGVFERVTVPFIAVDKNWLCTYINGRGAKALNTVPEHLIGKNIWEEFPQGISPIYQVYHKAFDEQRYIHSEDYSEYSNRWFESDVYPSPNGLSIFFNEITEQKRTEQALESSLKKTKLIMDSAMDAIICIDTKSCITEWNPQAEKIFDWTAAEVIGKKIAETIIPERFREMHKKGLEHYLRTGDGPALNKFLELTALRRGGTVFPIEMTIIPIKQNDEIFFCAFIRDISERKKAETRLLELNATLKENAEALAASNAELEQFAYIASHDLQEPLRTIGGFIRLLKERYRGKFDGNADKYMDFIDESAGRMKTLIKDLLDYSRIGKNLEMKDVDCNMVLRDALADLGKIIEEEEAAIEKDNLPVVKGYTTELKLLFQNLISNSLKFRKKDRRPSVKISAQEKDGYWQFSFSDNGIGIEEKNLQKIFIIFKRLHTRTQYEGSGIGLAHCKKIVELHGGRIWVESTMGEGSIFNFTLWKAS